MTEPRVPVFRCDVSEDGKQVSFWCPYCEAEHRHGWSPDSKRGLRGKSHKVAHCFDRHNMQPSPLRVTGYYVFVPARTARAA